MFATAEQLCLLANPIWNALSSDQLALAAGAPPARRFPEHIGPLAGVATEGDYSALTPLFTVGTVAALFFAQPTLPVAGWSQLRSGSLTQMVCRNPALIDDTAGRVRQLTAADAEAMLALATLTEPGPFRLRTHELGNFYGIFDGTQLMAMAGQRMLLPGLGEVSAVCTHPDARGRGYAALVMSAAMREFMAQERQPFLHALSSNEAALKVYRRLGFREERQIEYAVWKREADLS